MNGKNNERNHATNAIIIKQLSWNKSNNLIPAIIQDINTLQVLMLGYVNQESLEQTISNNKVTFYSRSKKCLWTKGETSGNYLYPVKILPDCDHDAILILVNTAGPTCHTGTQSCFDANTKNSNSSGEKNNLANAPNTNEFLGFDTDKTEHTPHAPHTLKTNLTDFNNLNFLKQLEEIIMQRCQSRPEHSYTTKLFAAGINRIAQKVGEEGVETALAAVTASKDLLLGEVADLIYHVLVLLIAKKCTLAEVIEVLITRHTTNHQQ